MNEHKNEFIHKRGVEMDKKNELLAAAREVFAEKGYKAAGISDIAKRSQMAVGSFYKYYESKEAIFLEVYVAENSRIREEIMRRVDWQGEPEAIVEQLFAVTFELISPNKILAEWNKPGISQILHDYYNQDSGRASNAFHQFLIQTFSQRLQEELPGRLRSSRVGWPLSGLAVCITAWTHKGVILE